MSAPQLTVSVQGQGVASADQLNTYEQTCDNTGELRAFSGTDGVQVYLRGIDTPGDGGQGPFYWNSTSTATDDNLTVIVPLEGIPGAWLRLGFDSITYFTPQYVQPLTGVTVNILSSAGSLLIDPLSPLALLVVTLPSTPANGQRISISTTQAITALGLTTTGGQSIAAPATSLAAGGAVAYQYYTPNSRWYPVT